jgi:hypothetical protein
MLSLKNDRVRFLHVLFFVQLYLRMEDIHSGENGLLVQLQHVRESNREKEVVMTQYQKMTGNIVQVLLKKREHAALSSILRFRHHLIKPKTNIAST